MIGKIIVMLLRFKDKIAHFWKIQVLRSKEPEPVVIKLPTKDELIVRLSALGFSKEDIDKMIKIFGEKEQHNERVIK